VSISLTCYFFAIVGESICLYTLLGSTSFVVVWSDDVHTTFSSPPFSLPVVLPTSHFPITPPLTLCLDIREKLNAASSPHPPPPPPPYASSKSPDVLPDAPQHTTHPYPQEKEDERDKLFPPRVPLLGLEGRERRYPLPTRLCLGRPARSSMRSFAGFGRCVKRRRRRRKRRRRG